MQSRSYLSRGYNQYNNISSQNMSRNYIKNDNPREMNNKLIFNKYGDKSFSRNLGDPYSSVNNSDNAKLRKFNSYSAKVSYKTDDNSGLSGFYVTPIPNVAKRIITVQIPEEDNINLDKDNYQVENVSFYTSPKKYIYKPYKPPKRKNKLKPQYAQKKNCSYYCNCPGCNKNRRY